MPSKTQFSSSFCSQRLKAIADPTRWTVLAQLISGPKNVTELNTILKMESTLLSHHLKILRDEGFVESIHVGKSRRYRLAPQVELTPSGRGINLGCCRLELDESFPLK
jgi:ArsR family transcriptional regulator